LSFPFRGRCRWQCAVVRNWRRVFENFRRSIGGTIDGQSGLGPRITGPRLENLSVQDSRYGAGIPIIYGSARLAGNVIWSIDLIEI
jgi:hypothetical protein